MYRIAAIFFKKLQVLLTPPSFPLILDLSQVVIGLGHPIGGDERREKRSLSTSPGMSNELVVLCGRIGHFGNIVRLSD